MSSSLLLCLGLLVGGPTPAPVAQSANFSVEAPTREIARRVAANAERARLRYAEFFLDGQPPDWAVRCVCIVQIDPAYQSPNGFHRRIGRLHHHLEIFGPTLDYIDDTVDHEVAHAMTAEYFGGVRHRWFNEGVSVWFEAVEVGYPTQYKDECGTVNLHVFLTYEGLPYTISGNALYGQGYSVVRFVGEEFGKDKLFAWYRAGSARDDWEMATLSVLGISLDDLDAMWRASLRSYTSPYPRSMRAGAPPAPRAKRSSLFGF